MNAEVPNFRLIDIRSRGGSRGKFQNFFRFHGDFVFDYLKEHWIAPIELSPWPLCVPTFARSNIRLEEMRIKSILQSLEKSIPFILTY